MSARSSTRRGADGTRSRGDAGAPRPHAGAERSAPARPNRTGPVLGWNPDGAGTGRPPADDAAGRDEDVQARVRERVRAVRTERGMTLAAAALAAGMDPSSWSRLESGTRRLTLDHLPVLARALGVRTDDLLEAPSIPDPRVRTAPATRDGMTMWPLNQHPTGRGHHAFKIRLPADRRVPDLRTHDGYDWIYVLAGRLRLVLGEEEFVLGPGEAAEFSTRTPHWMGVVDGPVELLGLFGPEGERVHVHG